MRASLEDEGQEGDIRPVVGVVFQVMACARSRESARGNLFRAVRSSSSDRIPPPRRELTCRFRVVSAMPADRPPLASRGSKSRLSKQAEVESEDPPQSNAAKIAIPETRVESFEMASDSADSNQSPLLKSKVLVRSHALCGDRAIVSDSSNEMYTDSTGINLADFIATTLHKNAKDRQMLLQLEDELRKFVVDRNKQVQKFPPMSSYNRMLVHRISAFFGLDHNVDQNGTAVVVNKTSQTRLPDIEFSHFIRSDRFTDEPKRYLRRDVQSYEEQPTTTAADYLTSTSSADGVMESPMSGYSSENYVDPGVARPWSSTDSHSSSLDVPHGAVMQKAGSYGGFSVGYRQHGESWHHPRPPPTRRSNTGDSNRADMSPAMGRQPSIPEGSVMGASPVHLSACASPQPMPASGPPVIFAVASLDQVPPGAMILNPHTGQPYVTAQGNAYRYNPYAPVPAGVAPTGGHLPQPAAPYNQMMQVDVSSMGAHMQAMTIGSASPADHPQAFTPHVYTYVVPHMTDHQPPSGQPSPGHHVYVPVQPQYIHGGVPIHYQQQQMAPAGVQCYLPTGPTPTMCSPVPNVDDHTQVTYAVNSGAYQTYPTNGDRVVHYISVPSSDHVSTAGSGASSDRTVEKSDGSAASHESQQATTTVNS
uniref:R3H domain-containing protein n=1 Tax=Plectus sambesii TaxID=2011161 RepID=A0A914XPW2_9BILA